MKTVLLIGYGQTGAITKKYLQKYHPRLKVGIADQKFSTNYLAKQLKYDFAIKTPGIPKNFVTIPYTTDTNIFFSRIPNLIIGVTGTKGKSTTASLIYKILKTANRDVALLGNIGKPMLSALLRPISPQKIFVVELSSYQLDDLRFSPQISVVLNLFPDHLPYHDNVTNYYQAKKNIINYQHSEHCFFYNGKYPQLKKWAQNSPAHTIDFNIEQKLYSTKLLGAHNQRNIAAAVSVTKLLKISQATIKKAVADFSNLPHRLELVGEFRKIKFYDDAISTTPESTIAALQALGNVNTIFLGGQDRGYDFSSIEKTLRELKVRNIVLFPESGPRILKSRRGFNILATDKMAQAVQFAYQYTQPGKICLLSAASPSYSLWKNFHDKGNQFQKFVKKYQ